MDDWFLIKTIIIIIIIIIINEIYNKKGVF